MGLWSTGFLERMEEIGLYKKPEMVEVVRCKDCKHRIKNFDGTKHCECSGNPIIDIDWFCADGEYGEPEDY